MSVPKFWYTMKIWHRLVLFFVEEQIAKYLQTCIKLLKQYVSLPHWNGSSETGVSLSQEAVGRCQHTPFVKAVECLNQIRRKTRKWVVIQTSGPDEKKPFAYISLFLPLLSNTVAIGQTDMNEIALYFLLHFIAETVNAVLHRLKLMCAIFYVFGG